MLCYCFVIKTMLCYCTEFHQNLPDCLRGSIVTAVAIIAPNQNIAHEGSQKPSAKIWPQFIKREILISLKGASSVPQNKRQKT